MGSDSAPLAEVAGAIEAARASDVSLLLVGDEEKLRPLLENQGTDVRDRVEIRHAPDVITMHDAPSIAVKQKKLSSMRICFDLAKAREVSAVVSAGNSGALMACGLFVLGRSPGVDRPPIVTTFPTMRGPCALLDMGANVDPKPHVLAQFAVMGAVYARIQHGKDRPRVALLSNGSESHKGTALTRETHKLLGRAVDRSGEARFEYVGYVEGGDIFRGNADVVVTDGFTGNVLLKGCEGLVAIIFEMAKKEILSAGPLVRFGGFLMKPALRRLVQQTDYSETGGAPLLGVEGVVVICHGGSDAKALKNGILEANHFGRSNLGQAIVGDIADHAFLWDDETQAPASGGAHGGLVS